MTKSRQLSVLIVLVLADLAIANQTWFTALAGEARTLIELSGVKTSVWLSPLLVLALVTAFVGFYINGKVTTFLLSIEAIAITLGLLPLVAYVNLPAQAVAKSGLIEKITGQTGTMDELSVQLQSAASNWVFFVALFSLALTAIWLVVTAVSAWRWKKTKRVSTVQKSGSKGKKSAFDLWDSQRG